MNHMEREQFESEGILKLILKHAGIIRQNYIVVIAMAIAGLVVGLFVQLSATDTYIKEVLLKKGNGLHLSLVTNLIQPTTMLIHTNSTLKFNNENTQNIIFGKIPPELKALNLQIVLRVANSKSSKIAAINNLPKDSRLVKKGSQSDIKMNEVIKRYKISNLKRGSDEIVVRFDGKSAEEAEAAVYSLVENLRTQFSELERNRVKTAFKAKLLIISSQLKEREYVVKNTSASSQVQVSVKELHNIIQGDVLMIALNSDKQKIASIPIEQIDINPFIVVPIDLSKKVNFINTKLWLVIATFAGLIFGLFICYTMYGINKLKSN